MKPIGILGILALTAGIPALAGPLALPLADSGLVSVYPDQSAQLNVVNTGNPAKSCSFSMSFIDDSGTTQNPTQAASIFGGESASLTVGPVTDPTRLRAHIDFTDQLLSGTNIDPMNGCYRMIPSFEIMNASTTLVLDTRFYGMPSSVEGEKIEKVIICHKPGTPAEKTRVVPISALQGHMGHGDDLGKCP